VREALYRKIGKVNSRCERFLPTRTIIAIDSQIDGQDDDFLGVFQGCLYDGSSPG
jgi:hypothetical protein